MIITLFDYKSFNDIKWRTVYINEEETKYSVSDTGLVRNDKNGKILKTSFYKGYERLNLTHNGKKVHSFVHRLVANAFVLNPEDKPEVNHIDGDKSNNYAYNLEWVTASENIRHAFDNGLKTGSNKKRKKISKEKIEKICKLLEENKLNISEIGRKVGVSRVTVGGILHKETYTEISHNYNIDNYQIKTDFSKTGKDNAKTIYSDEQILGICKLLDSKLYSIREISEKSGVDYQTVRNVYYGTCRKNLSKDFNFRKSSKNILYEERKKKVIEICELLDTGLGASAISRRLGIPRTTIVGIKSGVSWTDVSKNYNFIKNK